EVDDFRGGYRTARWTWWAYMDIPELLVEAWDQIAGSEAVAALDAETEGDLAAEIEGFFHTAIEQVIANRDDLHNMSPGMWRDFIHAGRVLEEPEYVHVAIDRLERLMTLRFFYDGSWEEGAPSYHSQVVGGLSQVFSAADGYSDPPGYAHEESGRRFDDLDIPDSFPVVARAREWLNTMRLPNGRFVPVHDTWSTNRRGAREASEAFLLPALGHACLGRGEGDAQFQAHLTWSPGLGHRHYDGLSLLLFANGRELLSDIGYTHTKARAWTLVTASHNTVIIDHENQEASGETYGALRYFDAADPACQVVSVDNPTVYPDRATQFRRTLAAVAVDEANTYLIDRFEVAGGETHDYFLHGSADDPQTLQVQTLALEPRGTLVPDGVDFTPAQNEGELGNMRTRGWPYGYLQDLASARIEAPQVVTAEYAREDGAPALRAHLALEAGDELVAGRNISVRNAGENDPQIDEHTRPFTMLRRSGGASDFVSVIEPIGDAPRIESARALPLDVAARALEITLDGRRDLVLFDADGVRTQWLGRELSATAEMVVLRVPDEGAPAATVVDGDLAFGDL
ncbi:MAG: heparinase II/III domain-containing protein, partial [Armatimonadota bacterium]